MVLVDGVFDAVHDVAEPASELGFGAGRGLFREGEGEMEGGDTIEGGYPDKRFEGIGVKPLNWKSALGRPDWAPHKDAKTQQQRRKSTASGNYIHCGR